MKNTLAQLQLLVSKIDRRHIQLGYMALVLISLITFKPVDGGGGPF